MATIADLNYTDDMAPSKKPFLTDIRATLDSIETYINDSLKDNLVQVANDSFGTSYAVDSDGAKNFTNDLYNKQVSQSDYTGGDITIATTAAWTDVDASNAVITLTPDYLAGDFKVTFQFSFKSVTSNATNQARVRFRLTDGSTNSHAVEFNQVTGVTGTTFTTPVNLEYEFDDWSVASKSVKLQYFIVTTTATTLTVLANTDCPLHKQAEKI